MGRNDFTERLKIALEGESLHAFAKRSGIGDSTLRKYLDGSEPGMDKLSRIAEAADVSLDWLIAGRGDMKAGSNLGRNKTAVMASGQELPGLTMVARLDIQASAGNGALALSEDPVDFLAFPEDWLRARNINPHFARILSAKGDSMEPTIRDGDILLVDTSIDRVRDNSIYIVVYNGLLLVKRMHGKFDGGMTLISDNTLYPPETIGAADVPSLQVAGRVMWFGRSI